MGLNPQKKTITHWSLGRPKLYILFISVSPVTSKMAIPICSTKYLPTLVQQKYPVMQVNLPWNIWDLGGT